jgi:hypothetical protein
MEKEPFLSSDPGSALPSGMTGFYRCTPSIEVNPPSMGSTAPVM